MLNPTLSDLVGGIESVTLSDEEARRRGTQKTVLERRSPPTFDVLIEIQNRDRLAVHQDVAAAVDSLLREYPLPPEIRTRDTKGNIQIERPAPVAKSPKTGSQGYRRQGNGESADVARRQMPVEAGSRFSRNQAADFPISRDLAPLQTVRIYPYGVARNRLLQAAKRLGAPIVVAKTPGDADVLVTLRAYFRKRERTIVDAESRNMPIYVLRSNTVNQMQQFLSDLFNLSTDFPPDPGMEPVMEETRSAIDAVLNGERWIELPPAVASIRRLQHQMARQANLVSHSYGKEPRRRVRIFRE